MMSHEALVMKSNNTKIEMIRVADKRGKKMRPSNRIKSIWDLVVIKSGRKKLYHNSIESGDRLYQFSS